MPSKDPKLPITLRLPKSVMDAWNESAARKGLSGARALMEQKLIDAVHPAGPPPELTPRPTEVEPRFRADGK